MLPIVATLLSSGLSLLGNAVLAKGQDVIEEKLGVKLDELTQTNDGLVKLRQIEMANEQALRDFAIAKKEQELKEDSMAYADTANARNMQIAALNQNDIFSKRFIYYFAIFWSVMSCLYIAFITFGTIPQANIRFADTILGFLLGTAIATIIQFFYGTSKGSRDKDDHLITAIKEMSK